jgi:hypothetical protein
MRLFLSTVVLLATTYINGVIGVGPTDEYRDADQQQSGYLPNHNLDPATVNSPQFGQLWKIPFNAKEKVKIFSASFLLIYLGHLIVTGPFGCILPHLFERVQYLGPSDGLSEPVENFTRCVLRLRRIIANMHSSTQNLWSTHLTQGALNYFS